MIMVLLIALATNSIHTYLLTYLLTHSLTYSLTHFLTYLLNDIIVLGGDLCCLNASIPVEYILFIYLFIYLSLSLCCCCCIICILACFGTNFAASSSSLDSFENANVENIVDYMKEIRFALDYNLFFVSSVRVKV